MGPLEDQIRKKIQMEFAPRHMELINESHLHQASKGAESHFKLLVVSEHFESLSRVERQRKVYDLLQSEMKEGVHALSLRLLSPAEWDGASSFKTPPCRHKE